MGNFGLVVTWSWFLPVSGVSLDSLEWICSSSATLVWMGLLSLLLYQLNSSSETMLKFNSIRLPVFVGGEVNCPFSFCAVLFSVTNPRYSRGCLVLAAPSFCTYKLWKSLLFSSRTAVPWSLVEYLSASSVLSRSETVMDLISVFYVLPHFFRW